jgi:hypothetical protein
LRRRRQLTRLPLILSSEKRRQRIAGGRERRLLTLPVLLLLLELRHLHCGVLLLQRRLLARLFLLLQLPLVLDEVR